MTVYTQISQNNWPNSKNQFEDFRTFGFSGKQETGLASIRPQAGNIYLTNQQDFVQDNTYSPGNFSTATYKYYGSSFNFGSWTERLAVKFRNVDMAFGRNPWTIEHWTYKTAHTVNADYQPTWDLIGAEGLGTGWMAFLGNYLGSNYFYMGFGSGTHAALTWSLQSVNQWVHHAFVWNGTSMAIYENGSAVSFSVDANLGGNSQLGNVAYFGRKGTLLLGAQQYDNATFNRNATGFIQDMAIYKTAKYTGNFTPPGPLFA